MAFNTITDDMREGKGNVGQPDTPDLNTSDMQAKLDELANLAIDFINSHIAELEATTAAGNIGAEVPSGLSANENIKSIQNALWTAIQQNTTKSHIHANKSYLDAITESVKGGYDGVVALLSGILAIQTSITAVNTAIPTSNAVVNYVASADIKQRVINGAYPVGSVYSTTQISDPSALLGYGTWSLIDTDANNVKRYVRTA